MNDNIKELAIKAKVEHCVSHVRLNEFAELIINQCIGVLNKRYMGDNNREDMEVRHCIEDIRKHFSMPKAHDIKGDT